MWSVWLVFCDCGFHSVGPLMDKDKNLMEASWWERLTVGETGSCSYSEAMLSKSLVQFSFDGWSCVPSLLFDVRPNYGGGNEDNGKLLQKVPCMHCCTECPQSYSRPPWTHASARDSWTLTGKSGSVSFGVTAFFLGPGEHKVLFVLSKSLFPQYCVSSGGTLVGLMVTSSKRSYAMPRSAALRAPAPAAGHCWPVPLQETLKYSSGSVYGVSGSWCAQGLFEPSECLCQVWCLILNVISPLLLSCWGFSFALGCGLSFCVGIQHSCVLLPNIKEVEQGIPFFIGMGGPLTWPWVFRLWKRN